MSPPMNLRSVHFIGPMLAVALCACARNDPAPAPIGADRDAQGCIGSAGYAWCEQAQRCERPWELARQQGFANSREAFDGYCRNPPATLSE